MIVSRLRDAAHAAKGAARNVCAPIPGPRRLAALEQAATGRVTYERRLVMLGEADRDFDKVKFAVPWGVES